MSDKFSCCSIERLLRWILAEEKTGQIFGIPQKLFFKPSRDDPFRMIRYGEVLETPIGVAAGPHTQLSQNIISAWLTGARYMELKTVQTLDELAVTKPCIDMTDEGYNCEWSQELTLDQSYSEYLNAWIILHVLKDKFGWGEAHTPGFIFNMSVGYNLEGILNPNVQRFLDRMTDCRKEKAVRVEALAATYPRIRDLTIPDTISNNLTVSTMHGCPPQEIEKIGRYFIEEKKLHTTIKLNPTLLGPARLREILNDRLGYSVEVSDEAFAHDLKYDAGISLITALKKTARKAGVHFNLKLTNTLEAVNRDQNLPDSEAMLYMSGRALHPISIALANRLQQSFEGHLDLSFSAGIDCFNICEVLACNIKPITVCSDLLKPGGYGRLSQYIKQMRTDFASSRVTRVDDWILSKTKGEIDPKKAGLINLAEYTRRVVSEPRYHKSAFAHDNIKTARPLTSFDCVQAPCVVTCPANQDVPRYMAYTATGEYEKAWQTILASNPFPRMQGMVCDHLCQTKCTRMNYDQTLRIREIKRFVAERHQGPSGLIPAGANGIRVAVVGAGPSGLACAYFLALKGFQVEIYESKAFAGGMAADAIPKFRLDKASLKEDIDAILSLGVQIHYDKRIDSNQFERLRQSHDYLYVAIGAQKGLKLGIPGETAAGVMDQLSFLSAVRQGEYPDLGKKVVIVGGGNSAIDAARTARRLVPEEGEVSILYRRTRHEMPAEQEEIEAALSEGVKLIELAAPECMLVEDGKVTANLCFQMELGEKDASGRRSPTKLDGSEFHLEADCVIAAIGQEVVADFFPEGKIKIDPQTLETHIKNVYAGGDAVRGASSLIHAIGDGKKAAAQIAARALSNENNSKSNSVPQRDDRQIDFSELQARQAQRYASFRVPETTNGGPLGFDPITPALNEAAAREEARRCLQCDLMCNVCVTVCPNRANIAYQSDPLDTIHQHIFVSKGKTEIKNLGAAQILQPFQIINIGDFCNECGNCATFCPTSGAPYQTKPTFYLTLESFEDAAEGYLFCEGVLQYKGQAGLETLSEDDAGLIYKKGDFVVQLNPETCLVENIKDAPQDSGGIDLRHAVEMRVLFKGLKGSVFV
jgi:putative selenate reductase